MQNIKRPLVVFNLALASILIAFSTPAYAYLDSGSGSIIIQLLFAGTAGLLAIIKLYWEKLKHVWQRFINLFKRKQPPTTTPVTDKHDHKTR